jgi:hypothetical protein
VGICHADERGFVTYHKDYYDMRTVLKQIGLLAT